LSLPHNKTEAATEFGFVSLERARTKWLNFLKSGPFTVPKLKWSTSYKHREFIFVISAEGHVIAHLKKKDSKLGSIGIV